jgi:hypothetical protein
MLRAFVDDIAAGRAAELPGLSVRHGTKPLGSGGYATVYSAPLAMTGAAGAADERVALKIATPAAAWEFAAARAIADRIPTRYAALCPRKQPRGRRRRGARSRRCRQRTARPRRAHSRCPCSQCRSAATERSWTSSMHTRPPACRSAMRSCSTSRCRCCWCAPACSRAAASHRRSQQVSVSCLQILHAMQQARVIHTDLKPDNCLLSWPAAVAQASGTAGGTSPVWSAAAASARGSVWGAGCLQAIDFGRAIDLQLLPIGTQFEGMSTTEGMQCPEMLAGRPWHFCVRSWPHSCMVTPVLQSGPPKCALACSTGCTSAAPHAAICECMPLLRFSRRADSLVCAA